MDGGICTFILLGVVTGTAIRLFFLLEISGSITSCPSLEPFPLFPAFGNSIGPDALTCSNALRHPRPLRWASSGSRSHAALLLESSGRAAVSWAAASGRPGESRRVWGGSVGLLLQRRAGARGGGAGRRRQGASEARKGTFQTDGNKFCRRPDAAWRERRPPGLAPSVLAELEGARALAHGGS